MVSKKGPRVWFTALGKEVGMGIECGVLSEYVRYSVREPVPTYATLRLLVPSQ
jgi:hypothetical protein